MANPQPTATLVSSLLMKRGGKFLFFIEDLEDGRKFNLPGGHVELAETPIEAVIREAREETGLEVQSPRLLGMVNYTWKGKHSIQFVFLAEAPEGEVIAETGTEPMWLTFEEARARMKEMTAVQSLEQAMLMAERAGDHADEYLFLYDRRDGKRERIA